MKRLLRLIWERGDTNLLKVNQLHTSYGNIEALKGISMEISEGEIITLIGANGAGKTTFLRTLSGILCANQGTIEFIGQDITKWSPDKIVNIGIAQVPEGRQIFSELTVLENLKLGAFLRRDHSAVAAEIEEIYELFPRLAERRNQMGGSLSGGEQQMLAIGRALMSRPKLLLLDEPSMGLAPVIVESIFTIIKDINQKKGSTVLLVEQNAKMALSIAQRGYVIETGKIVHSGSAQALAQDNKVKEIYLGG
jgi:branched-chain amino acid transport system ATP-binding protein